MPVIVSRYWQKTTARERKEMISSSRRTPAKMSGPAEASESIRNSDSSAFICDGPALNRTTAPNVNWTARGGADGCRTVPPDLLRLPRRAGSGGHAQGACGIGVRSRRRDPARARRGRRRLHRRRRGVHPLPNGKQCPGDPPRPHHLHAQERVTSTYAEGTLLHRHGLLPLPGPRLRGRAGAAVARAGDARGGASVGGSDLVRRRPGDPLLPHQRQLHPPPPHVPGDDEPARAPGVAAGPRQRARDWARGVRLVVPHLQHRRAVALFRVSRDAPGALAAARGHDLCDLAAPPQHGHAVLRRPSLRQRAVGDEAAVGGSAIALAVVVRAEAAGEEPQAVVERAQRTAEGVGETVLEPAVRAGADAAEERAIVAGLFENRIEAVHAPDREHVRRIAAADVDDVVPQHERAEIAHGAVEEPEVRAAREGAVEARHIARRVAARRRQKENARPALARERQQPIVEPPVARLHEEAAAAEGGDHARIGQLRQICDTDLIPLKDVRGRNSTGQGGHSMATKKGSHKPPSKKSGKKGPVPYVAVKGPVAYVAAGSKKGSSKKK